MAFDASYHMVDPKPNLNKLARKPKICHNKKTLVVSLYPMECVEFEGILRTLPLCCGYYFN
jgi:hypothetical protein